MLTSSLDSLNDGEVKSILTDCFSLLLFATNSEGSTIPPLWYLGAHLPFQGLLQRVVLKVNRIGKLGLPASGSLPPPQIGRAHV